MKSLVGFGRRIVLRIPFLILALALILMPAGVATAAPAGQSPADGPGDVGLKDVLVLLLSTVLPGTLAWAAMNRFGFLYRLPTEVKPFAAFAIATLLCFGAFGIQVLMVYMPAPPTWRGWIESLFSLAAWAWTVSQGIYWVSDGRNKAIKRRLKTFVASSPKPMLK